MATQTFELVSPFLTIYAPSKKWGGDSSLLLGQTASRLVAGELLTYKDANSVERPSVSFGQSLDASNNELGLGNQFAAPYFSETGRGDIITGGKVPVLQFGPFEADTMVFMREGDQNLDGNGAGQGNLAAGPVSGLSVGAKVVAAAVRNPLNGSSFDSSNYVIGIAPHDTGRRNARPVIGRSSRVIGSGAAAKIRVMFGVN